MRTADTKDKDKIGIDARTELVIGKTEMMNAVIRCLLWVWVRDRGSLFNDLIQVCVEPLTH